jgi:hypothetical protein
MGLLSDADKNKKPPVGGFFSKFQVMDYELERTEQTANCGPVNQ